VATQTRDEQVVEALIKLEVACRLALESMSRLPRDAETKLRGHVEALCDAVEDELRNRRPSFRRAG